jgi:hypothetical protein
MLQLVQRAKLATFLRSKVVTPVRGTKEITDQIPDQLHF